MKIEFNSQNGFELDKPEVYEVWLSNTAKAEGYNIGELGYVFCSDEFLWDINQKYLDHDTYTDIVTFDYTEGNIINGEIYISTERVEENAEKFGVSFIYELNRVMVHGLLHLSGYGDKTESEKTLMRSKEDFYICRID